MLQIYISLIAFNQQANSKLVQELIDADLFREVFEDFNIERIIKMNPCDLVDQYWSRVSAIRKQTKLFQIIMFARVIQRNPSVIELLTSPQIPKRITSSHGNLTASYMDDLLILAGRFALHKTLLYGEPYTAIKKAA